MFTPPAKFRLIGLATCAAWAIMSLQAGAQERRVAATVNDRVITAAEVEQALAAGLGGRTVSEAAMAALRARALEQLISRRLVHEFLIEQDLAPASEVEAAVSRIKRQLADRRMSYQTFLGERGWDDDAFRADIEWRVGWSRHLTDSLTDELLKEYFDQHRIELDGTQLRVRHILFRVEAIRGEAGAPAAIATARQVRQQIMDGAMSFAAAASRYSDGPSRREGGDLGFISRQAPMVEPFSAAAFQLAADEISEPVVTPFGVHLIQRTGEKPGDKSWTDLKDQIQGLAGQQLFTDLAARRRAAARISYAPDFPHVDPATGNLVVPGAVPATDAGPPPLD